MRSLSVGTAAQISEIISAMNYPSCTGYDLTRREMQFALRNSKVLFSHSHGANSYLVLADGNLQSTSIAKDSLTQLQLVYVSACNSGNEFVPALYNTGGAASAVGFKNTITASSSNDGIHFFNLRFFTICQPDAVSVLQYGGLVRNCSNPTGLMPGQMPLFLWKLFLIWDTRFY